MYHWLIFCSIFLGLAADQRTAYPYNLFGRCSCTGDPHVTPFPPGPTGPVPNVYYCSTPGWQILLSNRWVLIAIKVGPSPFVVLDYIVFFFKADSSLACLLFSGIGLTTCPASSGISSIITTPGAAWNHLYPLAQYLDIQINLYPWGSVPRYDFFIRETFSLIGVSTGLCVKPNCPVEQVNTNPIPIADRVCAVYIAAGQQVAGQQQDAAPVDDAVVKNIATTCQNDLALTLDFKFAQTAAVQVLLSSLDQVAGEKYQVFVKRTDFQAALDAGDSEAAKIIGDGDTCVEQKSCFTNGYP